MDTWSFDVQRIDGHRSGVSTRRARLLVDDEANAAWQRDGEVWVGYDDGLARGDQADELGVPADGGLATAAGSARVRLHDIGGHQTAQQAQVAADVVKRSEEHTSELQSPDPLVSRLLLEKKHTPS